MSASPVSHQAEGRPPEADEQALLQRAHAGDGAAFDALVLRHQQQAFAVALRMLGDYHEANDVTQDAFVRAFRAIGTFRGDAKFSTWLLTIVSNLCRNRRRWWARHRHYCAVSLDDPSETDEGSVAQEIADPAPGPSAAAMSAEVQRQIAAALDGLDEASRAVVVLRDVQGLPYEDIAQILRCRVGTVKSRLNRARLRLRALLDGTL